MPDPFRPRPPVGYRQNGSSTISSPSGGKSPAEAGVSGSIHPILLHAPVPLTTDNANPGHPLAGAFCITDAPTVWYMAGERTSVYLATDLAAAVRASGTPLAELIRRGLAAGTAEMPELSAGATSLAAIHDGEPSPGVLCMAPGCFQRDTRLCGLRQLPLCTACAAALQGKTHKREPPPSAAHLARRGAV